MMKNILLLLFLLHFSVHSFSQESLTRGKNILTGTWHGNEIRYFEQIISFFLKKKIPLDSALTIEKKYGGTLKQYDADDGYVVIEMPKETDILQRIAELELDSTLHGVSPLIQIFQEHYRTKEQEKQARKKIEQIQKKLRENPSAVDSANKSSLRTPKKKMRPSQPTTKHND
ncbi:MAG: hypothetical protein FJ218_00220 [Ignavibacteria bacterium]|nr:hypothetical protein [Ignavibacteria bacterium]